MKGPDMTTDDDTTTKPTTKPTAPTGRELAAELRRRRDRIIRAQGVRQLMANAYDLVADDLDERDRHTRIRHTRT